MSMGMVISASGCGLVGYGWGGRRRQRPPSSCHGNSLISSRACQDVSLLGTEKPATQSPPRAAPESDGKGQGKHDGKPFSFPTRWLLHHNWTCPGGISSLIVGSTPPDGGWLHQSKPRELLAPRNASHLGVKARFCLMRGAVSFLKNSGWGVVERSWREHVKGRRSVAVKAVPT